MTESMLLTLVGGFAGIWLAVTGVRWLRVFGAAMPRQDLGTSSIVPRLHEVGIDGTVLLFALGVSVVAGLACGLAPALWQSRVEARGELAREAGAVRAGVQHVPSLARARATCRRADWPDGRLAPGQWTADQELPQAVERQPRLRDDACAHVSSSRCRPISQH